MDFSFSDEQEQLRHSLRSLLNDRYTFAWRRGAIASPSGLDPRGWAWFAELGILGMALPERVGGLQLDPVSTLVVMEELGRAMVIEPYLETVVMCGGLLARAGGAVADQLLSRIGSGQALVAPALEEPTSRYSPAAIATTARRGTTGWQLDGSKSMVNAGPWSSQLLVSARTAGKSGERDGLSLFLVDKAAAGVSLRECATVDGRRAADITLHGVQLPADALLGTEGEALESIERATDEGIAALGAEAVGMLEKLQQDTLEYVKQRRQFGQPIGKFQVLQHRLVDMYMEIELACSAVYSCTLKLGATSRERALAASAAKVSVNHACRSVGQGAVQLHGGIGMTDDLAVSHGFKRASMMELELGTTDYHLARYTALTASISAHASCGS
jgi:alkylation response protein AidB-like acyl-CoA dehydrogenase